MTDPKQQLPDLSRKLLAEADALQALEREKRQEPISTPEFHALAQEIERRARRVFEVAAQEDQVGERVQTNGESIDEVARRQSS